MRWLAIFLTIYIYIYIYRSLKKQVPPQKHPTGGRTPHTRSLTAQSHCKSTFIGFKTLWMHCTEFKTFLDMCSPSVHPTTLLLCRLFQATACQHSFIAVATNQQSQNSHSKVGCICSYALKGRCSRGWCK